MHYYLLRTRKPAMPTCYESKSTEYGHIWPVRNIDLCGRLERYAECVTIDAPEADRKHTAMSESMAIRQGKKPSSMA